MTLLQVHFPAFCCQEVDMTAALRLRSKYKAPAMSAQRQRGLSADHAVSSALPGAGHVPEAAWTTAGNAVAYRQGHPKQTCHAKHDKATASDRDGQASCLTIAEAIILAWTVFSLHPIFIPLQFHRCRAGSGCERDH